MYIGKKLKMLRLSNNLTQEQLSDSLKVSQSYYSSIEKGKKPVSEKLLNMLLEIFKLDKTYFEGANEQEHDLNEVTFTRGKKEGVSEGVTLNSVSNKLGVNYSLPPMPDIESELDKKTFESSLEMIKMLTIDFATSNDELSQLYRDISALNRFERVLENLDFYYFDKITTQEWSASHYVTSHSIDYQSYKDSVFDELKNLEEFAKPVRKLVESIRTFYIEIADIDHHEAIKKSIMSVRKSQE